MSESRSPRSPPPASAAEATPLPTGTSAPVVPTTSTSAPAEEAQQHTTPVQIDDQGDTNDSDSAYGSSVASSSDSLASSITNYQYENGRRYHAYKEGEYVLPNDEEEQARLDLQHHIYRLCLGGELYTAPLDNPQTVLDIGTGTGIWAIEFADEFPGTVIYGTDLSPIQPGFVPPNVKFYVDDFEQEWEFPEVGKFDYVHWRSLCGSTGDWASLYRRCFDNVRVGGYLEVQEYDAWVYSDDDPGMERAPWTKEWCWTMDGMSRQFGKRLNVGACQKMWMEEAGFVDVQEKIVKVPLGSWAKDLALKELGRYERWHMNESVEAHSMALYTRVLNYSADQAKITFEMIKQEFNNKSLHLYTVYRFMYGRKPAPNVA